MDKKITLGISSCLLGNKVRHDGSHKRDRFITDILSDYFDFQSFCPETAIGMSIPRPAIRLADIDGNTRLVNSDDASIDHTDAMQEASQLYSNGLQHLSGYILKSKSPSCGLERVNLYNAKGYGEKKGVGIFAAELLEANPHLPVEEEGRLHDAGIRENFIERVFAYHRWQTMLAEDFTVKGLMDLHRLHKFVLLAHNESIYRQMGKLVADTRADTLEANAQQYIDLFSAAMKSRATRKRHVNVMQHCMGFIKNDLVSEDKQELLTLFEKYGRGEVPLVVPVTLLKYHFKKQPDNYINEQVYMNPYPEELMLRNHV